MNKKNVALLKFPIYTPLQYQDRHRALAISSLTDSSRKQQRTAVQVALCSCTFLKTSKSPSSAFTSISIGP
jgi:hypothetical protein